MISVASVPSAKYLRVYWMYGLNTNMSTKCQGTYDQT